MLDTKLNENAYVTIYDIRYLSRALVLINSIRNTGNNSDIVLLALDRDSEKALQKLNLENLTVINIEKLETKFKELILAKSDRSKLEYFFCLTPFVIKYAMEMTSKKTISYIDSDIWFAQNPAHLLIDKSKYDIGIVKHNFPEHLLFMEKNGIYNVGFLYFQKNNNSIEVLDWWASSCIKSTSIESYKNIYADQKYLESFFDFQAKVEIFSLDGHNSAPWNCNNLQRNSNIFMTQNGNNLIYFHFSGLRIFKFFYMMGYNSYSWRPNKVIRTNLYANYVKEIRKWDKVISGRHMSDHRKLGKRQVLRAIFFRDFGLLL